MKTLRLFVACMLGAMLLHSCQQSQSVLSPDPDPLPPAQGTPTEVGKPIGAPIQKTIGPSGGTISTPDNLLTLIIPAGALSSETAISIQPVENKAWSGTGLGYELSPKNLELAKPAELVWNYTDMDVAGSAPEAVGIAFQQDDRSWRGQNNVIVDKPKKRITAPVKKLLPAAFFEQYSLLPDDLSVAVTERLEFSVSYHRGFDALSEQSIPLQAPIPSTKGVRNWRINGTDLQGRLDPELGGISLLKDGISATYLAPNHIPKKNEVAISVEVMLKNANAKLVLVSRLTILGTNNFQINGTRIDSAEVAMINVVDGKLFQMALGKDFYKPGKKPSIDLNIIPFAGASVYDVDKSGRVTIHASDQNGKFFSESYTPRGTGKAVYGPLVVYISEYDAQKKRVGGHLTGTLHYYDYATDTHETAIVFAQFRAASPY